MKEDQAMLLAYHHLLIEESRKTKRGKGKDPADFFEKKGKV